MLALALRGEKAVARRRGGQGFQVEEAVGKTTEGCVGGLLSDWAILRVGDNKQ